MSLARNTSLNLLSAVVLVGIAIVAVPLYLRLVGLERYGVLSICWLLLGYMGLFDLGLGRAVTQGIAASGQPGADDTDTIFWTGLGASAALSIIAFLVALPIGFLAFAAVRFDDPALATEARRAVPLIACAVPVNMIAGIFSGALVGRSRFGAVSIIDVASSFAATAAPLAAAALGRPDLPSLVAASLLARAGGGLSAALTARALVPIGRPRRPSRALLGQMLGFGGWVSLSNIVGPILSLWDRFVIGVILGPRAVSVYVIPFSVTSRLLMVPEALQRALFPKLAGMERDGAADLSDASVGALSLLMTPSVLVALPLIYPAFVLWLGPALAPEAATIAYLLLPGLWANALALVAFALLHAQRRPSAPALLHLAEVVPYVLLLWLAIKTFGVQGAAALWSLRAAADAWAMFRVSSTGLKPLARSRWSFAVVLSATTAAVALPPGGLAQIGVLVPATLLGSLIAWRSAPPVVTRLACSTVEAALARTLRRPVKARGSS